EREKRERARGASPTSPRFVPHPLIPCPLPLSGRPPPPPPPTPSRTACAPTPSLLPSPFPIHQRPPPIPLSQIEQQARINGHGGASATMHRGRARRKLDVALTLVPTP
uniref:Uncharacterized protein n=1 Tax=Aegilops tauschii subsp. strangulata TaxID=200361 RepID=A0A452YNH2_AEGTS